MKIRLPFRLATLALTLSAAAAYAQGDVVAQRGTLRLSAADVRDLVDRADPSLKAQLAASPQTLALLVRERIAQLGLAAEARAKGIDQRPDVAQRMAEAQEAVLVQAYLATLVPNDPAFPAEADVTAAYNANKARFTVPRQYNLAQIAILVPAGAAREVEDEARRKAQDIRSQAVRPKADFADLAKRFSQERGAAERGGSIGWVREDQLLPGIRDAVAALADGAISEPVRGDTGWHVVKLIAVKPPGPAALPEVRDQIVQALRQSRAQQAARAYIDEMLRREPVQINEIDLARAVAPR